MTEGKSRQIPIEDGNEEVKTAEQAEAQASEDAPEENGGRESSGSQDNVNASESEAESDAKAGESGSDEDAGKDTGKKDEDQESERYMRLMAEFQNYKRRAAREKSDIHAYANEKIINELLPVLDNFERALDTKSDDVEGYVKGMELIFQQLKTALEHAGLKEIAAMGEEFDPNFHNAVMTEDSDEHDDGRISKVLQKGYTLNDKVIRPSMVAVVRK